MQRIEVLKRGVTDREEYEQETRRIRLDMYKQTFAQFSNSSSYVSELGVFVGHHKGDLEENDLCNIMKGHGIVELSGTH